MKIKDADVAEMIEEKYYGILDELQDFISDYCFGIKMMLQRQEFEEGIEGSRQMMDYINKDIEATKAFEGFIDKFNRTDGVCSLFFDGILTGYYDSSKDKISFDTVNDKDFVLHFLHTKQMMIDQVVDNYKYLQIPESHLMIFLFVATINGWPMRIIKKKNNNI